MAELSTRIAFSEEPGLLRDTAVSFCRDKSPMSAVRALLMDERGYDPAVWAEMLSLGWTGLAVPERFGGAGLSLAEAATLAEPMGRYLLATPWAGTQLFIQGLLAGGDAAQQDTYLSLLASGDIGTVALFGQNGDWDLTCNETTGVRVGQSVRLTGMKTLVRDAAAADFLLVSFLLDGAPALALLRAEALPPERRRREVVIDETCRSYSLDLDGIGVPGAALITGAAAGRALRAIGDAALLLAAAKAAGGIAGVLDVTVAYLNTRTAFGRRIGAFQSLKHACADILIGLERARSHVYHAATLLASNEDAEIALRMAKAEACDVFAHAGDRAVQFHGGFGFTYECDAQLFLRRALWLQYTHGDSAYHRRRLADLLLPRPGKSMP